jgi:hypothetical protein
MGVRRHKGEVSASNIQIIFCSQKTPFCSNMSGVHTILTFMNKTIRSIRVFLSFLTLNLFSGCKFSTAFYRNPRTCALRSTFQTENFIRLHTEDFSCIQNLLESHYNFYWQNAL